jgi:galactose oxidase-like protein
VRAALPSLLILIAFCAAPSGAAVAAGSDGYWTTLDWPSDRYGHTAVLDPVHDRMIVFGGYVSTGYADAAYYPTIVWILTLSDPPRWTRFHPAGSQPGYRYTQSAIYDPVRDRMIVFGGFDAHAQNDIWQLTLSDTPTWSPLVASGAPPPARHRHTAIYDPVRDRMIVYGGTNDTTLFADVWALSLSDPPTWSEITPPAGGPSPRYRHSAIYDPVRDRMIVFGGRGDSGDLNDTWALDLGGTPSWSELQPPAPLPRTRNSHTALYDPAGDRMIVYGGEGSNRNDAWSLALSGPPAWTPLAPTGVAPDGHSSHTAVLDAPRNRMIVFGGKSDAALPTGELSMLALGASPAWTRVVPPLKPTAEAWHSAIYDPAGSRLVPFAGLTYFAGPINEAWSLSLDSGPRWSMITPAGTSPAPRKAQVAVYDRLRERMVVYGGLSSGGGALSGFLDETWTLSLAGAGVWEKAPFFGGTTAGNCTTPRAFYDAARDRMILFVSEDLSHLTPSIWAQPMSQPGQWLRLAAGGDAPPPSESPNVFYDPLRDRMLLFGGCVSLGDPYNNLWAFSLQSQQWAHVATQGPTPAGRCRYSALYDPIRDRMLMIGGRGGGSPDNDQVWELTLADPPTWRQLSFAQPAPPTLTWGTAVAVPERDWIMVEGGYYGTSALSDTWILEGGRPAVPSCESAGDATWTGNNTITLRYAVSHPLESARSLTWTLKSDRAWPGLPQQGVVIAASAARETVTVNVAVPDSAAAGVNRLTFGVSFTGADGAEVTYTRDLRVPLATLDVPAAAGPTFLRIRPNPARFGMSAAFSLPAPGRVTLQLFDITGRSVSRRESMLGQGDHVMAVAPGRRLAPGVYIVRLGFGASTLRARAVVVE